MRFLTNQDLLHVEKPKIQIFCQGKKIELSNKNSQKFSFCENNIALFLPGFALVHEFLKNRWFSVF
jgi:hypothetical protein